MVSGVFENSPHCEYFCYMGLSDANYPITKKVILTDFECKGFVDPGCHKSLLDESVYKKLDKTF